MERGAPRRMRLTEDLVRRVPPAEETKTPFGPPADRHPATPADHEAFADTVLAAADPTDAVWIFAYGSLIWKPACAHVGERLALARGWRRTFCLGWDTFHRGSPDRPGLMLALDRGGQCRGVAYQLPPGHERENLVALSRRERLLLPHPFPERWINVETEAGPLRALTFAIDRKSGVYISGLADERITEVLATAAGPGGSMAEYLQSTVAYLEEKGIHDRHLWKLQDLVAERLELA